MSKWRFKDSPENMDSALLQKGIVWYQEHITELQASLADDRRNIAAYQAELNRRAVAAYWTTHPDLEPVAVGDKLLTLERYADKMWPAGTITTVERIDIEAESCSCSSNPLSLWRTGYLHEACAERRAYLAQQDAVRWQP